MCVDAAVICVMSLHGRCKLIPPAYLSNQSPDLASNKPDMTDFVKQSQFSDFFCFRFCDTYENSTDKHICVTVPADFI